jgi:hypothetical protein
MDTKHLNKFIIFIDLIKIKTNKTVQCIVSIKISIKFQ